MALNQQTIPPPEEFVFYSVLCSKLTFYGEFREKWVCWKNQSLAMELDEMNSVLKGELFLMFQSA